MKKILLVFSALLCSLTLSASIVWVTNTNDSGAGSLREAMQVTVQNGDVIRFSPALIASGSDTIMMSQSTTSPAIFTKKDITIIGLYNSTDTLFLSGGGTKQIFYISHSGNNQSVQKSLTLDSMVMIDAAASRGGHMLFIGGPLTIKNSIFRGGKIPAATGTANEGGSIYHTGMTGATQNFVIENCKFYDCKAQSGGAILTKYMANITITNSVFYNNEGSIQGGGAITTLGQTDIDITSCIFHHNTTAGDGGALYCSNVNYVGSIVDLSVTNSSFYQNVAANSGGAIGVIDVQSVVSVNTSTIVNNYGGLKGGAMNIETLGSTFPMNVSIEKSTISKNTIFGYGSGSGINVRNVAFNAESFLTLKGVIIADNGASTPLGGGKNVNFTGWYNNSGSGFTSNGHNLIGERSVDMPLAILHPTDEDSVLAVQLNLGTIQYNGGATPTMLPGTGSIALNKGDTSDLTAAQNGAITDGFRDIGAAEYYCIIQKSLNPISCGSYTSPSGKTWTVSGTYMDTLSIAGCDSIFTINLSINNSTATINEVNCNNYTSPSGKIWTVSNTYLDTIPNASGCDSFITINLVIKTKTTSTISPSSCGVYTSPSGKIWNVSNAYTDTIPNAASCDSIITINLTIITINKQVSLFGFSGTSATAVTQSGATFQWLDCNNGHSVISGETNKVFTASTTGSYAVAITKNGCIDTSSCISITVPQPTYSTISPVACITYTSPSGKIWTVSNTYMDTITNSVALDSIMTINLTINQPSTATLNISTCGTYTSPSGKIWTTTNTYKDTILNNKGCDSVVTITLTVVNNSNAVTLSGITLTATQASATYKWLDCNNSYAVISGATSRTYTPIVNGTYAVEITKNSCVDTTSCTVIASVGINENAINDGVIIYPNPTNSILNIDTKGERIVSLRIFSISGQLIDSELNNNNTIDVSNFKSGLYIIQVETQNGIALSRFIKK